eukprot:8072605-Alexandrium_andersonii.AAC.1
MLRASLVCESGPCFPLVGAWAGLVDIVMAGVPPRAPLPVPAWRRVRVGRPLHSVCPDPLPLLVARRIQCCSLCPVLALAM